MRRNLVGCCGLLVAIGLACQPADAGDRKSATREAKAILVTPEAHDRVITYERRITPTVGVFENGYPLSATRGSSKEKENAPPREHKALTLFHFNSKLGDVAVQPVFGKVTGAQFSVGF